MAGRVAYGLSWSSNGWPMVDEGSCTWVTVPGTDVSLQIQEGQPLAILRAFAADFNAYVEPLRDADSACWTPTNSVPSSNHLSGTAMDLNWNSHPFRVANAGFDAGKIATIKELQDFYEGTVFWGNEWSDPKDAMHFQLASLANGGNIDTYGNPHTADFIARKIRTDGFSTFRRGNSPAASGITGDALAEAWYRRSGVDYNALAPGCNKAMIRCGATTVNKSAMFLAQLGHESGGGFWREEISSGQAYEGRIDLGNTQPGDGQRFKGRSFVQVTGRTHYLNLSAWAHGQGYVPTPTFFIDNPPALANAEYVWLGAVWYFLTQRPGFMDAAERGDLEACTRMVNGGLNGLDDRRNYWNRARAMGDRILPALATPRDPIEELLMSDLRVPSWSIYADPGEPDIPIVQMIQAIDAAIHRVDIVEPDAREGDPDAIRRLARTAAGQGTVRTPFVISHALRILTEINAAHPEWIIAATPGKA